MRLSLVFALLGSPALSADYLDDRSSPPAVVASLYNAVSRHEYARAWSYFAEDAPPAASYDAFAEDYAGIAHVEVVFGTVEEDGTAGHVYATVPVELIATGSDGKLSTFGGCYVTRLAEPTIQAPPFHGIEIVAGRLVARPGPGAAALPGACAADGRPSF
jgi:hypothetical protein